MFQQCQRLIRLAEVRARTGLSTSAIYDLVSKNQFPPQIQLTKRRVSWVEDEVNEWIEQKIREAKETTIKKLER